MGFEFVEHSADIRARLAAGTWEELLASGALALTDYLSDSANLDHADSFTERVTVYGEDRESVMVNWLSELLLIAILRAAVPAGVSDARASKGSFSAAVSFANVPPVRDIKAVTYHDLAVENEEGSWRAGVTFDV